MFSKKLRTLAFFLMALMVFYVIPVNCMQDIVSALSSEETQTAENEADASLDKEGYVIGEDLSKREESAKLKSEKTIIREDESKRGKFEKHFVCSDGTYVAVMYAEAVHYQKDGKWIDSNNSISLDSESGKYKSENTDFNVAFASSQDMDRLITVTKDNYTISWNLKANSGSVSKQLSKSSTFTNDTKIKIDALTNASHSGKLITDGSAYDLPETKGKITYENAFSSDNLIDVIYTVSQDKIKEDIVIKAPTEYTSYTYEMEIGDLLAFLNDDNSISLCDKDGTAIYTVNTPYMYDSSDEFSYDIDVSVEQKGTVCIITYSPNKEWITSKERIYPIVIDPVITTKEYTSGIIDTFVRQNKTTDYSNNIKLFVGKYSGNINRSYIKLTALPEEIENANLLNVSLYFRVPTGTTTGGTFALRKVNSAWAPSTITYANQPTVSSSNTDSVTYTSGQIDYAFDVTNDFLNNSFSNGYCLRYADESINDYNTFWSNEYGTIADRPYFVFQYNPAISLNRDQVELSVGSDITLEATAYNTGHPVIWSSSNSSIATVDSTGKVTAIKPGFATITSTLIISNGESIEDSCQVIVKLQNGVYYIQNRNSNYHLNVDGGKIVNGTDVQQYYQFSSASDSPTKLRQMWKTYYLGNGYYSIRPMHKLNMGLNLEVTAVNIFNAGTVDDLDNVPLYCKWTIQWDEDGYVFKNNGLSSLTMQIKSASTSVGAYVVASPYSDNQNCKWNLTLISSPPSGVYLYDKSTKSAVSTATEYVAPKETRELSAMSIEVISYNSTDITQTFVWTPSYGTHASVDGSGTVTGKTPGTTTVTAEKFLNGSWRSVSFTVITTEIANGTYFIKNRRTEKYVDIDNNGSMNDGAMIEQHDFDGADTQRWIFTHLGDGYYSIKSENSTTAYYLGVENDSTENDAPVVLRTGSLTSGMKWKIVSTTNGALKIIPQTGEANNRVLAVGYYLANTNGVNIEQRDYVDDDNYKDEWFLYNHKDYTLMYIGCEDGDPSMPAILSDVETNLLTNASMEGFGSTSLSKDELLVHLSTSSIFSCITHGDKTSIETTDGTLTVSDINSLNDSAFEMLEFVYFGACETGKGKEGSTNLVNAFHDKGADVVLGFTDLVLVDETNLWTQKFMSSLSRGSTIRQAIGDADYSVKISEELYINEYTITEETRYLVGSDQIIPCD